MVCRILALCIDQQPARKIERGGVRKQLVQIGVGGTLVGEVLVLRVAHEHAFPAVPPGEVRSEMDADLPRRDCERHFLVEEHVAGDAKRLP